MSDAQTIVLNRLRANLATAGINAHERIIQGMLERGFLAVPSAFDALSRDFPMDLLPDYLANWGAPLAHSPAAATLPEPAKPTLGDETILGVAARLQRGELSPVELMEQTLARIAERDPVLNAFQLVLAERARAAARQAEAEIQAGDYRGPLHGVPLAVKDLLDWAGTPTTAGSKILADNLRSNDSAAVERLEAAGAIIVGKTRMSEFAYAPGSHNPNYGHTRNPRNLAHDTGGSSSGSAAAVAAGLVYAALGSDTGCSIRMPAAFCGLVGLKPTYGRVSLAGSVTLSWSLDHAGPLTRSVADAALLLSVLAGYDHRDSRTRPGSDFAFADFAARQPTVRGLRIGVLRADGTGQPLATPEVLAAWQIGVDKLADAGAELVEIDWPDLPALRTVGGVLIGQEAIAYHQPNLRTRFHEYGDFLQQRILAPYAYDSGAFVRAQQLRGELRRRAACLFERIDLLTTPSIPTVAPLLGEIGSVALSIPFNLLGWPAISLPVGNTPAGLPVGLQLVGKPWDELTLLQAAQALEEALYPQQGGSR